MPRFTLILVFVCTLALAACAPAGRQVDSPSFHATDLKGDPRIIFTASADLLLIDITSPTGIGSARIEKTAGQWPPKIVMRLRLKGLESFKFTYGDQTIALEVSSQNDKVVRESLLKNGQQTTLTAGDPYWMNVTPGNDYFDVEAPLDFFKSGATQFTMEWIDFYR